MTGHRRPPSGPARSSSAETAVMATVALALAAAGWFWVAAGLARWATGSGWPALQLSDLLEALRHLRHHVADPSGAWPAAPAPAAHAALAQPAAPAPAHAAHAAYAARATHTAPTATAPAATAPLRGALFYGSSAVLLLAVAVGAQFFRPRGRHHSGARWARTSDLRALRVRRPGQAGRLVLGRAAPGADRGGGSSATKAAGRFRGGPLLATEARHSVLVIGPTQSGKTTGLAIPAILEWPGPVVATSVKDDLAAATFRWRASAGPCWVFDPTCSAGLATAPRSRWSPVTACDTWSSAQKTAAWLVESTPGRRGMADAAFWYTTAGKQLAPLLLAAQRAHFTMADVVRWTDSQDYDEPTRILQLAGDDEAVVALTACAGRDERIRSSVSTTLETVLSPFSDPVVAAATSATDLAVDDLLSGRGTLYLCGPTHEQNRVQGLFAALVSTVIAAAVTATGQTGRPLDPPLLLVLDEAANIAPIRDLDTLASTGAGLGIQLVTVCQDLAQLAARYDPERARTIANNHRAKLLLSGVSDLGTLDLISGLAGERAVREESTTQDLRGGGRSRSVSTAFRRLAPTDQLRRVGPGHGVLVYGHLPPVRVRLRPWYQDRTLRRRAGVGPRS